MDKKWNKKNSKKYIKVQKELKPQEVEKVDTDLSSKLDEIHKELDEREADIIRNITNIVENQIEVSVSLRLREEEKKILRRKNFKIFRRDVLILILIGIIAYLVYSLYSLDYYNIKTIIQNREEIQNAINSENTIENKTETKIETKKDYVKEYSKLVDNMQVLGENQMYLYVNDCTKDTLPEELKLQIAYKNIDKNKIEKNDDTISFKSSALYDSLKNICGKDVSIKHKNFTYNDNTFIYYNDTYISSVVSEKNIKSKVKYVIDTAYEKEDTLVFEVLAGKLEDSTLKNIATGDTITKEFKEEHMSKYKEKLTRYKYTFLKVNDNYYFESIERI